jgi:predicted methyltransferase MtxX (methanogen marker protein 4)
MTPVSRLPEAALRLIRPWWETRATLLGETLERALADGESMVALPGRHRVTVERLAVLAEEAIEQLGSEADSQGIKADISFRGYVPS